MKIVDSNRMGAVAVVGTGKNAVRVKLTPAAVKAIRTVPAADRDAVVVAADAKRREDGHPRYAGHACNKVWDHHIASAMGVDNTPEAQAAWRTERGLPRPSVA